jgi:hypothetical protein
VGGGVSTKSLSFEGRLTAARRESIESIAAVSKDGGSMRRKAGGLIVLRRGEGEARARARAQPPERRDGEACSRRTMGEAFLGLRTVRADFADFADLTDLLEFFSTSMPRDLDGALAVRGSLLSLARVFVTSTKVPKARFGFGPPRFDADADEMALLNAAVSEPDKADFTRLRDDFAVADRTDRASLFSSFCESERLVAAARAV